MIPNIFSPVMIIPPFRKRKRWDPGISAAGSPDITNMRPGRPESKGEEGQKAEKGDILPNNPVDRKSRLH